MKNRLQAAVAAMFGGKARISSEMLRKWNIAAAVLLIAQGLAIVLFSGAYSVPLYFLHMTGDALQSKLQATAVVAPAIQPLWQVNIVYVLAVILLLTAFAYLAVSTVWHSRYESWMKRGVQPIRWVLAGVVGSLLIVTIGLLGGVVAVTDLKLLAIMTIVAALAGAWWELKSPRGKHLDAASRLLVTITTIVVVVPLLDVAFSMLGSIIFGNIVIPGYLWGIYATVVAAWLLFVGNAWLLRRKTGKWSNYLYGEAWYVGVVLLAETLITWGLFAAVLHP